MRRVELILLFLLMVGPSVAQQPDPPTPADLTRADIDVMEMVGGSPLTQAERVEVAHAVAEGLRTKREEWLRGYANAEVTLNLATFHNAFADAQSNENWRRDYENMPAGDGERLIIERHDPVVAVCKGQNGVVTDLVTRKSLRALVQAAAWAYSRAGLPMPAGASTLEAKAIQQNFESDSMPLKLAFAHVERNFAAASAFLAGSNPKQAQQFLRARLTVPETGKETADPGAQVALLVQDLYNEVLRRGINPVKLSLSHSKDPLMQMYIYNADREAWHTMNP